VWTRPIVHVHLPKSPNGLRTQEVCGRPSPCSSPLPTCAPYNRVRGLTLLPPRQMSRFLLLALALVIAFVSALPADDATKHLDDHSAVDIVKKALKSKVGEEAGCAAATCAAATSGTPAARSTCNLCNAASQCKWQWNSKMEKAPLTTCGTGASGNAANLGTCICKTARI
jgi:hypothetical protein